jgi:hypothetical protein
MGNGYSDYDMAKINSSLRIYIYIYIYMYMYMYIYICYILLTYASFLRKYYTRTRDNAYKFDT